MQKSVEEALESVGVDAPQHRRETSEFVAAYEPGTGTVEIENKATAEEERVMVTADRDSADSLAEVKEITEDILDDEIL